MNKTNNLKNNKIKYKNQLPFNLFLLFEIRLR